MTTEFALLAVITHGYMGRNKMKGYKTMTSEEAIKTIRVAIAEVEWNYPLDYAIAFETAIEALEKQIPKKPIPAEEQDIRYVMKYTCPSCGKHFTGTGIADYCYHCGKALDWRETE